MKRLTPAPVLGLTLAVGLSGAAFAQMALADMDTDANGTLSLAELQVVYKTLDETGFAAIDANADGAVDDAELTAAVDGGKLVAG
jgi:Ca2+-binding EF-hand superfamily protein